MNTTVKGLISDLIRGGAVVAAVLVIILNVSTVLNIPAQYVAYISIAAGIVNAALGALKPYAVAAVKGRK